MSARFAYPTYPKNIKCVITIVGGCIVLIHVGASIMIIIVLVVIVVVERKGKKMMIAKQTSSS